MANCQRQPQFGCWLEAGLAVGAIALATSHSSTNWPLSGRGRTQQPRPREIGAGAGAGPQQSSQLQAPAYAAPDQTQPQHTTQAPKRQRTTRQGRSLGAQASDEGATPRQNRRPGCRKRYARTPQQHKAQRRPGTATTPVCLLQISCL